MATTNLTASSFYIYIEDRDRLLSEIYWETCSGFSTQSTPIRTSNGRQRYFIPTKPEVQPISLTKAANVDEDKLIWSWLQNFCTDQPILESDPASRTSGAILILVPLKPCAVNEPYQTSFKAYNIIPTGGTLWNADISDITSMSRVTLELTPTSIDLS